MNVFRLHARSIALTIFLLLLTLLAGTALLGVAGHFLTAAALAGVTAMGFNFFGPSAGIRALTFVRILSRYAEKLVGHDVTLRLARDLRVDFFRKVLPLAPLGLGRHRMGDLLARLVADIENVDGLLVRALGPLLALTGLGLTAVAVTAFLLPAAGALLALTLLSLGVGIPYVIARSASHLETARAQARAELRTAVLEGLEGATDLAALEATGAWIEHIDAATAQVARREREGKARLSLGATLHAAIVAVSLPAMLWLLLDAAHSGRLSPAAAGGLFFMAVAVYEAAAGIGLAWQSLRAARASQQRLRQVAAQAPLAADAAVVRPVPPHAELEFREIGFHWPDDPREVLREANLRLGPGQRIALGGDSGAGKSSLLALALRLCDPQSGSVRYGGIDLRQFAQADWHAQIAWLPQDAPVFAGSVRDNLRMGAPEADDARLWLALSQVKMEGAIRALPEGLDAWVGENGATLSAGQSRRIALARALLRDTPLLLLDEPTEGLDTDTANELLLDLAQASGSRTVLMISHDELPEGVVHASYRLIDGRLALQK
ncbi:thiol reductant ABC exporter subunit CydC [Pseudoxanthomonas sacheonensis]|uniref:thiol reductant ABC exporter subunit CydC n=1 Tax=Pseudoxanthomonas sacheonensis TaxID=443615 RepID=UPI0013D1818C|nr:thiol reductant ABC exporter subunit CydC [Pseudoxanthomonas sacheonensis]KAF1709602.1 thiol reductant ABC exporter subunit CydC [Pseudoxanthomonas sacheonensis]